jgi:hypothetical protein
LEKILFKLYDIFSESENFISEKNDESPSTTKNQKILGIGQIVGHLLLVGGHFYVHLCPSI